MRLPTVKTADPDVDRLMKHARRIEQEGKTEIAAVVYSAASEIARIRDCAKTGDQLDVIEAGLTGHARIFWRVIRDQLDMADDCCGAQIDEIRALVRGHIDGVRFTPDDGALHGQA